MTTFTVANAVVDAMLDAITTCAGTSALIKFYTGTMPLNNGSLSGNTLLGTLTCSATFAPASSGRVLTVNTITQDSSADATGTATWARVEKSDGTTVIADGDVNTSNAAIILNNVNIVTGGPIALNSFTISM
jgi:hypothetical protein